jgi:pyrimidine deaminase RibD-like protein/ubiquinone/menaquinone biosynthesis C-methylase UbiE
MITEDLKKRLMLEAIEESKKSKSEDKGVHPFVGAILVNSNGDIIEKAHRGERGNGDHAEFILLSKAEEKGLSLKETSLFVTLEPCTTRGSGKTPCAQRIAERGVETVYIGMLDPNPRICGVGETYLRDFVRVERFPHELVKIIAEINTEFLKSFKSDYLPNDSLFVSQQVSAIMLDLLKRNGLAISTIPADWDVTIETVIQHCSAICTSESIEEIVLSARRKSFDKKYHNYSYEKDVRGIYDWKTVLLDIFKALNINDISKYRMVNVGIGNGLEGKDLFENLQELTLIDIGEKSLKKAQEILPKAKTIISDAESLSSLDAASYDIYISLRTYQSSYFDISHALKEAQRIIRPGGLIIISIANGFIGKEELLVPGLVIPNTNVVDKNKPYELADSIRRRLTAIQFGDIGMRTSPSEIYVYGRKVY